MNDKANARIRRMHKGFKNPRQTELSKVTSLFTEGLALHQAGRLVDAEKIYSQILSIEPDHFDSLHLRGVIFHQRGNHAEAVHQIDLALKKNPNDIFALCNRGIALKELKRFDEALASFDHALTVRPDYAEAHLNRGATLFELKRFEEALASYDRALAVRPDYAEAFYNCGITFDELRRLEEALVSYDRALAVRPDYAEVLLNRGITLHKLKRFDDAVASYDRALALRPDYAEALSNRGNTLHELRRFGEALASYDRAITVRPQFAGALYNRGNTLRELKRFGESLASYDRALMLQPTNVEALVNRGNTLKELAQFKEALACYDGAVGVRPDCADAHFNAALCRMLIGDLKSGWEENEWRWETEQATNEKRSFVQPLWRGSNKLTNKTILLHAEQGFGDTIQFCRYVPRVAERAARVILEVQRPLHGLMSTLPGVAQVILRGEALPDFDTHCPLLSLPLAFGTRLETIPAEIPYLRASPLAAMHWDARLGPRRNPRIGIAWSGRTTHKDDHNRSIGLSSFLSLLAGFDATFVSLQPDVRAGDAIVLQDRSELVHFGDELKDFSDTAALVSILDLIVTVDTSVAHLAGALGKPVWILLPFIPDWRWLLDREDSPWYPTARLFRQSDTREWDAVISRVHAALCDYFCNL